MISIYRHNLRRAKWHYFGVCMLYWIQSLYVWRNNILLHCVSKHTSYATSTNCVGLHYYHTEVYGTSVATAVSSTFYLANQAATHYMQAFHPCGAPWTVTICFCPVSWESSLNWDSWEIQTNEWTFGSGYRASLSIEAPLEDHGGRLLYRGLWVEGEILFYQETLCTGHSMTYLKGAGCGNVHLFP
jgi:hypothetical protein